MWRGCWSVTVPALAGAALVVASVLGAGPARAVADRPAEVVTLMPTDRQQPSQALCALVRGIGERLLTADQVAAAKWLSGAPVEDAARERRILDEADARAKRLGVDPENARRIVRYQIEAGKDVQRGLLDRWRAHPGEAPAAAPDLTTVRERISGIDEALLVAARDALPLPGTPSRLSGPELARAAALCELGMDPLHARALRRALAGLYSPA